MNAPAEPAGVSPPRRRLTLAVVLAAAAALRLINLDLGLPGVHYVDAFKFVDDASHAVAAGSLAPDDYQYPGLYRNLLALIYLVAGIRSDYACHLTALLVSALAGIALVWATYVVGRRVLGEAGASLAAALVAADTACVTYSRVSSPDMVMTALLTAMLAVLVHDAASTRRAAVAGVLAGLAAGAKLTGLLALPFLPLWAWVTAPRDGRLHIALRRTATAGACATAAFLLTTPYALTRAREYADRFALELAIQRGGQIGRIQSGYLDYLVSATPTWEAPWLGTSMLHNEGALVLLAACTGLGLAFGMARRRPRAGLLGAWAVVFLAVLAGPGRLKAFRFVLPVLPVAFLLAAFAVSVLAARLKAHSRTALWAVVSMALLAVPSYGSLRYLAMTTRPPTEILTREWMEAHTPTGAKVLVAPFYLDNLDGLPLRFATLPDPGSRQYRLPPELGDSPERHPLFYPEMVEDARHAGIRFVVLCSAFDGALAPVPENVRYFPRSVEAYREFRLRLAEEGTVVYSVRGFAEGRTGPDVTVYELRDAS